MRVVYLAMVMNSSGKKPIIRIPIPQMTRVNPAVLGIEMLASDVGDTKKIWCTMRK